MKRTVTLSEDFLHDSSEVVVELLPKDIPVLALEISLLIESLASSVSLKCPNGGHVDISLDARSKWARAEKREECYYFQLGRNQAQYFQATLLRAYRDNMAAVSHIHLEGQSEVGALDLTICFQLYAPPMSSEDAIKLMGKT